MEELNIIIEPELEFSLKKCGEVVPYGITPEEREKLAGIEENANNYTHPETHPSSILDVVDVVNGAANKFLNERGEMVAVAHESLTDKNSEAAFQHINTTTTKTTLAEADMVAIKDSVTGNIVLTPKSNLQTDLTPVNQAITNLQNNKADKTQEDWITPTLLNGWVRFNQELATAQFYKDSIGIVHLRGIIKSGTVYIMFTLPKGYRPSANLYIPTVSNGIFGYINVFNDGTVGGILYSNAWVSLENIIFKAEL